MRLDVAEPEVLFEVDNDVVLDSPLSSSGTTAVYALLIHPCWAPVTGVGPWQRPRGDATIGPCWNRAQLAATSLRYIIKLCRGLSTKSVVHCRSRTSTS